MSIEALLQLALRHHQAGELQHAENIYKETLNSQPDNFHALHYLGVLYYQIGQYDSAIKYISKALEANPADPHAHYNLGNVYKDKGDLDKALHYFQESLRIEPNNADAYVNKGIVYRVTKRLDKAITCFQKALELDKNHFLACYNLGISFRDKGQLDAALRCFEKCIEINPNASSAYYYLGLSHQEKGTFNTAIHCYQKALQFNPNSAEVYYQLGLVFQDKGQMDRAIDSYKKALSLNPGYVAAYNNLGLIFKEKGDVEEAIQYFKKALQLNQNSAEIYNNLGDALQEKGNIEEAIRCYQRSSKLNPNLASAYNNLGNAFKEKGNFDEAIQYYQKALQLNPNLAEALNNLGSVLKLMGRLDEAILCYRKSIQLYPKFAGAHNNLGNALMEQGKFDEAMAAFDKAIACKPDYITAYWAKCMKQLPVIYQDHASIESSRRQYNEALVKLRDIITLKNPKDIDETFKAVGSSQPFYLAYQGLNDRDLQQRYGGMVCKIMAAKYPRWAHRPAMPMHKPGDPLKIGIASRFFCNHANWKIPIKGWIENLDRKRFSLFGYYTGRIKDSITEAAKGYFTRFVEGCYSFQELSRIIRDDNLHVLIFPEIGMDPMTVRLAALRLAPVQCVSWGHPDTSGLPTVDYFLSSELAEPAGADDHYSENLVRLPNLSVYYTPHKISFVDSHRGEYGLRTDAVLYHCCQSLYKFLPQYDVIFPQIARKVGNCQFLFASYPASSNIIEQCRARIFRAFDSSGLSADEHIVFLPFMSESRYNALHGISDVFLDPIGWSGWNSTLEAIDFNLPIVTFPSNLMRGRGTFAILTAMGIRDTIASNLGEYSEIAARLGTDSEWRKMISDKIAAQKHLIYRDRTCITALEDFLERMVREKIVQ